MPAYEVKCLRNFRPPPIGLWTDVTRGSFECGSDTRTETGQLVLTSLLWAQSVKRYWDEALVVWTFCGERTEAGLTRRGYCACVSAGQEHEVSASIPIPSCVSFPDQRSWHPKMQLFPTIWRSASSAEGKWGLPYQPVSSDQVPAQKCCNWELLPPIAWGLVWDGSQRKTLRICVNVEVQRPGNWVIISFGVNTPIALYGRQTARAREATRRVTQLANRCPLLAKTPRE